MVVQLANRETICLVGIVRDVEVLCGKTKYPADFLALVLLLVKPVPLFLVDLSSTRVVLLLIVKRRKFLLILMFAVVVLW